MAGVISRKELSSDDIKKIQKHLTLQPQTKVVGGKSFIGKDPIMFFMADKEKVRLPYFYSYALKGNWTNEEIKYPKETITFTKELRDGQKAVVQKVAEHFKENYSAIICAPTGYGKTAMGCYVACMYDLLTVVLCPMTILLRQWKQSFEKFTDAKVWIVGEEDMPKSFNVVICLLDRVCKLKDDLLQKVGLLIIDEAHLFCTKEGVIPLLSFTPKYILGETATPERTDNMKIMLQTLCGNTFIEPKYNKKNGKTWMTLAGYTSEVKSFDVVRVNTGVEVELKTNKMGKMDWSCLVSDLSSSPERNKIIVDLATRHKDNKIMILVFRKSHVEELVTTFEDLKEEVQAVYGSVTSYSNCRILIGTNSKMGTGFDEENSCYDFDGKKADILIMCCSFRSEPALTQAVGRIFRSEAPLIYHLVDNVPTSKSHWYVAKKWYESRGANISIENM